MPFLALVELIERLPLIYSEACVLVAGPCIALETSSFSRLVTMPSAVLVTCLSVSLRVGAATLMPITMDFS
jgi:hypothetical protein